MISSSKPELPALLERSRWFRHQSDDIRAALMAAGRVVELASGQWLHSEGDASAGLWSVLRGSVRLEASVGNRDVLLNIVGPGPMAGQAVGPRGRRLVTVRAAEASQLFIVSDASLHAVAAAEPVVWRSVSDLLYAQLQATIRLAAEALSLPPEARLAVRLLAATRGDAGIVRLRQTDLAELTGLSRKSVNGRLLRLQRASILRLGYRSIEVLDRRRLLALAMGAVDG